jgi:hypothetical protein
MSARAVWVQDCPQRKKVLEIFETCLEIFEREDARLCRATTFASLA